MTIVDLTIVNVALPTIGRELHFSESNLQWVVTAYGLTFGGFLLLGGRAADLLGRRRIFMIGLAVFTAASLGCALATTDWFADRDARRAGSRRGDHPARGAVDRHEHVRGRRRAQQGARASGVRVGASGATFGLIAGGLLTRYAGWEYIFFLNVPIGVVAAAAGAARRSGEPSRRPQRRRYDPFGAVSVTGGLLLLVYTISNAPQVGWGTARTVSLLAASGAAAGGVPGDRDAGRGAADAAAHLQAEDRSPERTPSASCSAQASSPSSSSARSTCSRSSATRRCRPASPGSPRRSPRSRSPACRRLLVTRGSPKLVMAVGMALIGVGLLWTTQVPVHGHYWCRPARAVLHHRTRHRVRVHPGLDRGPRRRRRARGRAGVRPAQHLPAARRRARGRCRVHRRGRPREDADPRR